MSFKESFNNFCTRTKRIFKRSERDASRSANRAAHDLKKAGKHAGKAVEDLVHSSAKITKNASRDIGQSAKKAVR